MILDLRSPSSNFKISPLLLPQPYFIPFSSAAIDLTSAASGDITGTMQVLASSVSGVMAQLKRSAVDVKMGGVLVAGGAVGAVIGVLLFRWLRYLGVIDTFVILAYVFFLGSIGGLMFVESARAIFMRTRRGRVSPRRLHQHYWLHRLPLKTRFPISRLYISALVPVAMTSRIRSCPLAMASIAALTALIW